jgi:hypothetical protein
VLAACVQWRTKGNLLSDFGIGPWRKKNEEFVALFASTYSLTEQRIGAASTLDPATGDYMGNGGVVRLLNVYPAKHQVPPTLQYVDECAWVSGSAESYPLPWSR